MGELCGNGGVCIAMLFDLQICQLHDLQDFPLLGLYYALHGVHPNRRKSIVDAAVA